MTSFGRAGLGTLLGLALVVVAGCGGGAGGSGGKTPAVGAAPTTLPAGDTLGCVEAPADTCVYGGAASAPSGLKAVAVGKKITPDMFKLTAPMALVKDTSTPGGAYIATPDGTGDTNTVSGDAAVAVTIPSDGYYQIWAGTQSADATTNHDSLFVGMDGTPPTADNDHVWDINPDGAVHQNDTAGGCIQIRHTDPGDQPDRCDAWHFKKGIVVIHIAGRESNSHLLYLEVLPAKAA